jgi:hypothetical protein
MKRMLLVAVLVAWAWPAAAQAVIVPSPVPACTDGDTLVWDDGTDNFICTSGVAASQPLSDGFGLIKNAANGTKVLAFNVAAISSATTRTWTIPDANITVPSTLASLATNTFTGLQTLNGGLASTTGTFSSTLGVTGAATLSSTLGVTGAATLSSTLAVTGAISSSASVALTGTTNNLGTITSGVWNAGAVTSSGGISGTTGAFSGAVTISGAAVNFPVDTAVGPNTSDAADNKTLYLKGGGGVAATRGAYIGLFGNEQAGLPGVMYLVAGSTGSIQMFTGAEVLRATLNGSGAWRWAAYGAGTLTTDASGNITAVSDERLKDRIEPLGYGLAEVLALRPVRHGYNAVSGLERDHLYGGFLAQDVQRVMPLAVNTDSRGYLTLSDRPITAALVTAVQEHDATIQQLAARIAVLEGRR